MQATCEQCGVGFEAKRATAKFCTTRCRTRATRARAGTRQDPAAAQAPPQGRQAAVPPPYEGDVPLLVATTISELAEAGRLSTTLGQQAVQLATRMMSRSETGAAVASLNKELRATMADALKGVTESVDPLDELRARRARKRTG